MELDPAECRWGQNAQRRVLAVEEMLHNVVQVREDWSDLQLPAQSQQHALCQNLLADHDCAKLTRWRSCALRAATLPNDITKANNFIDTDVTNPT